MHKIKLIAVSVLCFSPSLSAQGETFAERFFTVLTFDYKPANFNFAIFMQKIAAAGFHGSANTNLYGTEEFHRKLHCLKK